MAEASLAWNNVNSEIFGPILGVEQQDEPQPLPFYGGCFWCELLGDLVNRLVFAGLFWAMIEYEFYFLLILLVPSLGAIFRDGTNYRYFVVRILEKI